MPIWGQQRVTWRQILPPVAIGLALLLVALTLYRCTRQWRLDAVPDNEQNQFLRRMIESDNPATQAQAIRLLGESGTAADIPLIRGKLGAAEPAVVGAACAALGRLGDQESAPALLKNLASPEPETQAGAAEGIGYLRDRSAVGPLVKLLESREADVRYAAIVALGGIGDPAAAEPLKSLEADPTAGLDAEVTPELRERFANAVRDALGKLS